MCCRLRERIMMAILWVVFFAGGIIAFSIILYYIPMADARVISVSDLSPRNGSGDIISYLFRYEIGASLISGRIEEIEFTLFNGTEDSIQLDLDNIKVQCQFEIFETVCDTTLDSSNSDWGCWPAPMCIPSNCKGLCGVEIFENEPLCWGGLSTTFCAEVTMVPHTCYELRILDSERCKFIGNLSITQNGITDILSIENVNIPTTGTLDHVTNIDEILGHVPFDGQLLSVNQVKDTNYNTMSESNLCSFNNVIGCRAPVRRNVNGDYHDIMEPFERISGWNFKYNGAQLHTAVNRQIGSIFNKQNTLESHIGTFNTNLTGNFITFEQHEIGEMLFTVDIEGRFLQEVLPVCPIQSVKIECNGIDTQELMTCEIDIVVGHDVGSPINVNWNGKPLSYECVSQTKIMPSIARTQSAVNFCVSSIGTISFCKDAEVLIVEDNDDDEDKGQNEDNSAIDINKEREKIEKRRKTNRIILILLIIGFAIVGVFGGLFFFSKEFMKCFMMGRDGDESSEEFRRL